MCSKKIKKGEVFNENNITTKRPFLNGNFHASEFYNILGKVAERDYDYDDFIKMGEISNEI